MAITDKDVIKLKGVFATKEDLNRFATKDDISRFATKDELKNSIDGLRTELSGKIDESAKEVKMGILGGLDKVMDELAKSRDEQTCARGKDREQDLRLDGLEIRMSKVEAKVN